MCLVETPAEGSWGLGQSLEVFYLVPLVNMKPLKCLDVKVKTELGEIAWGKDN